MVHTAPTLCRRAYADANGASELIQAFGLGRFERTFVLDAEGVVRFEDGVITTSARLEGVLEALLSERSSE